MRLDAGPPLTRMVSPRRSENRLTVCVVLARRAAPKSSGVRAATSRQLCRRRPNPADAPSLRLSEVLVANRARAGRSRFGTLPGSITRRTPNRMGTDVMARVPAPPRTKAPVRAGDQRRPWTHRHGPQGSCMCSRAPMFERRLAGWNQVRGMTLQFRDQADGPCLDGRVVRAHRRPHENQPSRRGSSAEGPITMLARR